MIKSYPQYCLLLLFIFQFNFTIAQIQGGNMPGMSTPNKAEPSKLDIGSYVGDVNIFSGNYQNTIALGTVSTPGGLSYSANLTYNSKNQVSNIPQHVGGIPYGEGWSVSVPSITIKTVSKKIGKKTLNNAQNIPYKRENFTNEELYQDGDPYYYYPFLNIPGEVSGRLILKEKVDERSIFVLDKFEKYVQAEFYNGVWDIILDDGRVFTFDYIKNNSRNAPNNRLDRFKYELVEQDLLALDSSYADDTICIKFDPIDPSICLEEEVILKYVMKKEFKNQLIDAQNQIGQDLAKTIRPIMERTAWYPSQLYNPSLNDQMIFFEYETFGQINFHQEYLQNNFQFFFLEHVIEDVFGLYQANTNASGLFSAWDGSYSVPQINVPDLSRVLPYMKPYDKFNDIGFLGNVPHNCGTVFRDIFLKSIIAADMSNGYIPVEKIDLNYQTFDVQNYANTTANFSITDANMLLWKNDPFVVRFDSLYSMKSVYQKGSVNDPNFLPFDSQSDIDFSSSNYFHWTRYRNLRSDKFLRKNHLQVRNYTHMDNANVYDNWNDPNNGISFINDRNPYALNTNNSQYYFGRQKIPTGKTSLQFDHSFLESERINGTEYVSGDNYEIRTSIQSNEAKLANFDIELVSGSLIGSNQDDYIQTNAPEATVNGINIFSNSGSPAHDYLDPEKVSATPKSISFFNTFNNLIKWSTGWSHNSSKKVYTSNNFTFPNLPAGFNGFHFRIGPATSDQFYNFGLKDAERWDLNDSNSPSQIISNFSNYKSYYSHYRNQEIVNANNPFTWNGSIHSYSGNPDNSHSRLWDTDAIPNNFGNGSPWYMMDKAQVAGFASNWLVNNWNPNDYWHHRFWWNNFPIHSTYCASNGNSNGAFPNKPTSLDLSTSLLAVQINRMSKNPYVLKDVKKYRLSGYYDYLAEYLDVDTIWDNQLYEHLEFEYEISQVLNPSSANNAKRNIFLLSEVKKLNLDNPNDFIATQFEYEIDPGITTRIPCQAFYSACPSASAKLAFVLGSVVLMNKIIDNLGGETLIEYADEYNAIFSSNLGELWDFGSYNTKPPYNSSSPKLPPNIIQEVVYPVSRIGKMDESGTARYKDYSFEGLITDGAMLQYNLFQLAQYNGASIQQSINGFEKATIQMPALDPNVPNKRARVEYEHFGSISGHNYHWFEIPDDHPYFLMGKVKSKKEFDEAGHLIKEKRYVYKATKAYVNYYHRRKFWTHSTSHCEFEKVLANFNPGDQTSAFGEYFDLNLIKNGKANSLSNWYLKPDIADIRVSPFEDQKFMDAHDPPGADSYFVRLLKEEDFEYYPIDNSVGDYYTEARSILTADTGFFHTIKEYSYYDADIYGRSNNNQYKKLLRKGTVGDPGDLIYLSDEKDFWENSYHSFYIPNNVLKYRKEKSYQPSWQISAIKTYTGDDPNSYTLLEKYYMFDLQKLYRYKKLYGLKACDNELFPYPKFINDVREDTWMIKFHYDYLKRNSVFQTETTHHKPGMDDVKTREFLTYSDYKSGIVSINSDEYDVEYKNLPQEFCDILSVKTDNNRTLHPKTPYYKNEEKERSNYLFERLKRTYQKSGLWEEYLLNEKGIKLKELGNKDIVLDNVFQNLSVLKTAHIAIDKNRLNEFDDNIYSDHSSLITTAEDFLFYEETEVQIEVPNIKIKHFPDGSSEYYSDSLILVTTNMFIPKIPFNEIKYADVIGRNRFGQVMLMEDQKELRTLLKFPGRNYTYITDPVKTMKKYAYDDPANGNYNIVLKDVACRYRVMNFGQFGVPDSKIEGFGLEDALKTKYTFDNRYNLIKSIDPNSLKTEYNYDGFNRLKETKLNGKTINSYNYQYWNSQQANSSLNSFYDRAELNYVDAFTHYEDNIALFSRSHYDPLGREFHTSTNNFNFELDYFISKTIHSGSIEYDRWNRPVRNYKAFRGLTNALNPMFNYSGYFQEMRREANSRGLTYKSSDYGIDINGGHSVQSITEIIDRSILQERTEASNSILNEIAPESAQIFKQMTTIDQDNKKNRVFVNSRGQKVAQTGYLENGKINTYFVYDAAGNMHKSINDKGQVRKYFYNSLGLMYRNADPDAGVTLSWYDKNGNLEFVQDENLRAEGGGYIRKLEYDHFGRLTSQKKISLNTNFSSAHNFITDFNTYSFDGGGASFQLGSSKFEKRYEYGKPKIVSDYIRDEIFDEYLCSKYSKGKLSRSESYDESGKLIELNHYFYNRAGLQNSYVSQFNPDGIMSSAAGILNRVYYEYDRQGRLINKILDLNADNIIDYNYCLKYDYYGRLSELRGGLIKNLKANHKLMNYSYDEVKGLPIRRRYFFHDTDLNNSQIDELIYSYEFKRDRLKKLSSDLMEYQLYYDDDTVGFEQYEPNVSTTFSDAYLSYSNNFNGNINAVQFTGKDPNADWKTFYGFHYDKVNRLVDADAFIIQDVNNQDSPLTYSPDGQNSRFKIGDAIYEYDDIGNLDYKEIGKWGAKGNAVTFHKTDPILLAGNNKFRNTNGMNNAFTYDNNGNVTIDLIKNNTMHYGRANLPHTLINGGMHTSYKYNSSDIRIFKEAGPSGNKTSEYYFRDQGNQILAIFTNNENGSASWEHFLYGGEKFGKFRPKITQQPNFEGYDYVASRAIAQAGNYVLDNSTKFIDNSNLAYELLYKNLILGGGDIEVSNFNHCNSEANQACLSHQFEDTFLDIKGARVIFKGNTILKPDEGFRIRASTISITFGDCEAQTKSLMVYNDTILHNTTFYQNDHLGNTRIAYKVENNNGQFDRSLSNAMDYYPFGKILREYNIENEKFKFTGKERDDESGYDYFEARLYDSDFGRFLQVDPLGAERSWLSSFNYGQNNPIMRIDPNGRLDGDYYDKDGNHLGNDGIDDDKVYTVEGSSRFSINNFNEGGQYYKNNSAYSKNNGDGYSVNYEGTVSETKLSFTGEANSQNSKQADGQISLIQVLDNGKEFTKQSLVAVGGPYGNGAPPNGDYTVDGPRLRSESGFTGDGFGFSFNLNPTFETGRTLLRIHPDGNNTGTLGCVGIQCTGTQGRLFYNNVSSAFNKNGALNMNINIIGNLNNQGGGVVPNFNE